MADEILTPEQVQKRRACAAFVEPPEAVAELCESHEALRAERDKWKAIARGLNEWFGDDISPEAVGNFVAKLSARLKEAEADRDRLAAALAEAPTREEGQ